MADDTLTVTDGVRTEQCTVVDQYEHRGDTFAKVEGDTLNGFVEVPQ